MTSTLAFVSILFVVCSCRWTAPVRLLNFTRPGFVVSTYRDPVSSLNHVVAAQDKGRYYSYLAVADDGSVIYQEDFYAIHVSLSGAVIRGADDGKHLLMAYLRCAADPRDCSALLIESSDSGKTWKKTGQSALGFNFAVQDLVYDAGWTHLVMSHFTNLNAYSRGPGRSFDSFGKSIAKVSSPSALQARATFTSAAVHVISISNKNGELTYTASRDNGTTWTPARRMNEAGTASAILAAATAGNSIFFAYTPKVGGSAMLIRSDDSGRKFEKPVEITKKSVTALGGLAALASPAVLVGLFPVDGGKELEYTIWTLPGMKAHYKAHPFAAVVAGKMVGAGVACAADKEGLKVGAFVVGTGQTDNKSALYFSVETDAIPSAALLRSSSQ